MSLFQYYCIALALSVSCCLSILVAPRELAEPLPLALPPLPLGLARMADGKAAGGGLVECWKALTELRSCTNEIVLFFLSGDSYLSLPCCRAIRVITRDCWPAMITASLGYTSEEADVLRGYCDVQDQTALAPPPSPTVTAGGFGTDEIVHGIPS